MSVGEGTRLYAMLWAGCSRLAEVLVAGADAMLEGVERGIPLELRLWRVARHVSDGDDKGLSD